MKFKFFIQKAVAVIAALLLSVCTLGSAGSATAESTAALGDVDMDGIITGHDSAMVSHYLYVDAASLTDEQLVLADMNEDGTIDQTDADLIHEQEAYTIGDVNLDGETNMQDAREILLYYAAMASGTSVEEQSEAYAEILEAGENQAEHQLYRNLLIGMELVSEGEILDADKISAYADSVSEVCYDLMDVNADGTVDIVDADRTLTAYAIEMSGWDFYFTGYYDDVTRYDLAYSPAGHPAQG